MAGGLAALLDDIALIAKTAAASVDDVAAAAAKTSAKAAGVVIDDAAVTPRFVEGVSPARELPIIWRITQGSLFNKIILILPAILALNAFAPWLLTPILMIGGLYLSYEGAEKIWELIGGNHQEDEHAVGKDEKSLIKGAVTTDFILSAEIMVISLNEVADETLSMQAAILLAVALAVTIGVYGAVGLLVKMDDLGLNLLEKSSQSAQRIGKALVVGMPKLLNVISFIGMFAMLWVGGHIVLVGANELGLHAPYHWVHEITHKVEHLGGFVTWCTETFFSLIAGLIIGGIIVAVMHVIPRKHTTSH